MREGAVGECEKLVERSIKLFQNNEVVVFLLPAPVHVRDAGAALHDLQDLAFLQDGQNLVIGSQLVLLSLHPHALICLRVDPFVEQVFMGPLDP